MTLGIKSQYL